MANHGPAQCQICNKTFMRHAHNAVCCSDPCRRERDNRRKRVIKGPLPGHRVSICSICGVEFKGKLPHYPYRCCGAASCRKELRHRGGLKAAETVAKKLRAKGIKRECLNCGDEFWAPNRFVRICPACKGNREANPLGVTWWGAVI